MQSWDSEPAYSQIPDNLQTHELTNAYWRLLELEAAHYVSIDSICKEEQILEEEHSQETLTHNAFVVCWYNILIAKFCPLQLQSGVYHPEWSC
jgi:hypothetical protein